RSLRIFARTARHEGTHAPTPVASARRAPEMQVSLSSRRTAPLVFDRTQNDQTLHVDATAGGGRVTTSTVTPPLSSISLAVTFRTWLSKSGGENALAVAMQNLSSSRDSKSCLRNNGPRL